MKLDKCKKWFLKIALNFLIADYSSWKFFDISNFRCQNLIDRIKKRKNSQNKKGGRMTLESHTRTWVKSIVWRLFGIVILGTISWIITDSWKEMSIITLLFHSIRVILYYFHERAWERISWGRIKHPLSIFPINKEMKPEDLKLIKNQLKELGYLD